MRRRWLAAWHWLFGCRICHNTGVIMSRDCDCGRPRWSGEPHEAYCGVCPCPHKCRVAETSEIAYRAWRKYL